MNNDSIKISEIADEIVDDANDDYSIVVEIDNKIYKVYDYIWEHGPKYFVLRAEEVEGLTP